MSEELDMAVVSAVVARALAEDLTEAGDVTTLATIPPDAVGSARLITRQAGVIAGLPIAAFVFDTVSNGRLSMNPHLSDGARVRRGDVDAEVTGPIRDLLTAERTALNLLGHLSGVASLTKQWVD